MVLVFIIISYKIYLTKVSPPDGLVLSYTEC